MAFFLTFFGFELSAKKPVYYYYKSACNEIKGSNGNNRHGNDILKNSVRAEGFFINTAGQSSLTTRLEERSVKDAFFVSFFEYSRATKYSSVSIGSDFIDFKLQQRKIIWPHHHFW